MQGHNHEESVHGHHSHGDCPHRQQSHGHHHHHGEIQAEEKVGKVRFTSHEGALVCNAGWEVSGDYPSVQQEVQRHMDALAAWVEEEGGIIGHIKCFLEEKLRSSMLSTTGDGVNCVNYQDNRVEIRLTVIVYAEDAARLCKKIEELMEIH